MRRLIKKGNFEIELLKHSRNPVGEEALTFQWTYDRIIHAEMMTHRWSRNYSSSRAIPYKTMMEWIAQDPSQSLHVGSNRAGMQAGAEIERLESFREEITKRQQEMAIWQDFLVKEYDPHKEVINRYSEPWGWITGIGTMGRAQFMNFIALRCTRFANANIQRVAINALRLYAESVPQELSEGEWHTPYFDTYVPEGSVRIDSANQPYYDNNELMEALIWSTARSAWISYNSPTKDATLEKAIRRHDDCVKLKHATPLEHQLRALVSNKKLGLVPGFESYRMMIPGESVKDVNIQEILDSYDGCDYIVPN